LSPSPASPASKRSISADALNAQIQFAHGLGLAILGEAHITGSDSTPINQLVDTHIEQLETIAHSFEQLRAGS
jgi:hypothetical protein